MNQPKIEGVRIVAIAYTKFEFEGRQLWKAAGERYITLESLDDKPITAEMATKELTPKLGSIIKLAFDQAESGGGE